MRKLLNLVGCSSSAIPGLRTIGQDERVPAVLLKWNCLLDICSADSEFVGFGKCGNFGTE